jgi:hypothetical protein
MIRYAAIDLDRTVFDTDTFTDDIITDAASMAGVPREQFSEESKLYRFVNEDGLSHYDLFGQLSSYGCDNNRQVIDELGRRVRDRGNSYVYKDVGRFIVALQAIGYSPFLLTYGETAYQIFKARLCDELRALPTTVVLERKANYLQNMHNATGVLFDDMPQPKMPVGWVYENVDRAAHLDDALLRLLPKLY